MAVIEKLSREQILWNHHNMDDNLPERLWRVYAWLCKGYIWDTRYQNWEGIDPTSRLPYQIIDMNDYCEMLWLAGVIVKCNTTGHEAYCTNTYWKQATRQLPSIDQLRLCPKQF